MSSFAYQSCKSCRDRQEDLLESGDGSQVVCYCYNDLTDDEICKLEISEEVSDISQVEANEDPTNAEFAVIDMATQSTTNTILRCTTLKNRTSVKSMQPPVILLTYLST